MLFSIFCCLFVSNMSSCKKCKRCIVPICTNNTISTPNKLFINVPKKETVRKKWFKAMKQRKVFSTKTCLQICEDHFDLEKDISNLVRVRLQGVRASLHQDVIPHKFYCQRPPALPRLASQRRNRKELISAILASQLSTSESAEKAHLYVLFEHAAGYALFKSSGYEEDEFLSEVQKNAHKLKKFKNVVTCVAFQPFRTGRDALENINCISEGILHSQLQEFLENNVPKTKKKKHPVVLGVSEPKLAAAISEKIEVTCTASSIVGELMRGIRYYFHELVEGFSDLDAANKAQLGLGHHYSRARVKFNVNRIDNMIIQSISLLDQLDKDINTFTMRVREWYSHHFPELIKVVPENALFIQCIRVIKDRKDMPADVEEQLEEILKDAVKVQKIMELARSSMGMDIASIDLENVYVFAERILSLTVRREELKEYLRSKMHSIAPNLAALIGDVVGARLIAHAGSLINLAKYPASTVQILGAEKALFRALKTRGNTPKYGLIFHSKFIGKAAKSNKGRISRYLANKCSVASRIDCFRDIPTDVFGHKLRAQVEERLKFYETGDLPKKNVDAMTEAMEEAEVAQVEILKQLKKDKKKKKKQAAESGNDSTFVSSGAEMTEGEDGDVSTSEKPKKKKKKRKQDERINGLPESGVDESMEMDVEGSAKKKQKLSFIDTSVEIDELENGDTPVSSKKKKKKKKRESMNDSIDC